MAKAGTAAVTLAPERLRRRQEIVTRINGSGDIPDHTEAIKVAKEIEAFEYADGNAVERESRMTFTKPMLGSGKVHMRDIVAKATEALSDLAS